MTVSFYMQSDPGNNNPGTPFSYAATHRWGNDFLFYDYRKSHVYVNNRINGGNTRKLNDGQWHAICMSWNSDGTVKLFVDFEQTFTAKTNVKINGNGIITMMRVENPTGIYKMLEEDNRIMVMSDPNQGERGSYDLLTEASRM